MWEAITSWDLGVLEWIQNTLRFAVGDVILPLFTNLGDAAVVIAIAVILCIPRRTRKWGFTALAALIIGVLIVNAGIKPLVFRPRPYAEGVGGMWNETQIAEMFPLLRKIYHDGSFPSGHTLAVFEIATAVTMYSRKAGIPALAVAALIAFSRLYLYVHYPTDVLVGMVLGIGFGILAWWLLERFLFPKITVVTDFSIAEWWKKRKKNKG